jgi:hypothetical protein
MDEKVTKPTIETVLERMNAMEQRLGDRIGALDVSVSERIGAFDVSVSERIIASEQRVGERIDALEERLDRRLDRMENLITINRSEFLELRMDYRDVRAQLKEHIPALR